MNDFVNRQELLDGIEELKQSPWFKNGEDKQDIQHYGYLERKEAVEVVTDLCIKKEPSAWIPVSERLPEESGEYLVVAFNPYSGRPFVDLSHYFIGNVINNGFYKAYEVIAWMPLPQPYKVESEDKNDNTV